MGSAVPVSDMKVSAKNPQRGQTKGNVCVMTKYTPPQPITISASAEKPNGLKVSFSSIGRIIPVDGFCQWRVYRSGFQVIENTTASTISNAATATNKALTSVVSVTVMRCVGMFLYTSCNSSKLSAR